MEFEMRSDELMSLHRCCWSESDLGFDAAIVLGDWRLASRNDGVERASSSGSESAVERRVGVDLELAVEDERRVAALKDEDIVVVMMKLRRSNLGVEL